MVGDRPAFSIKKTPAELSKLDGMYIFTIFNVIISFIFVRIKDLIKPNNII